MQRYIARFAVVRYGVAVFAITRATDRSAVNDEACED